MSVSPVPAPPTCCMSCGSRMGIRCRVGILDGPCGVGLVQSVSDHTIELQCFFETNIPSRPLVDVLLALPGSKVLGRLGHRSRRLESVTSPSPTRSAWKDITSTRTSMSECYRPLFPDINAIGQAEAATGSLRSFLAASCGVIKPIRKTPSS